MSDTTPAASFETLALLRDNVRSMRAYTPGEQVNDCLKLNTNECAWPPAPGVLDCLKAIGTNALRLYPDPVSQQLRSLAAELWGHPLKEYLLAMAR